MATPAVATATSALQPSRVMSESERRQKALEDYRKRLIDHRELDAKLKKSKGRIYPSTGKRYSN